MYENANWAFENAEKAQVAIRLLESRTTMLPEGDRGFANSLVLNFKQKKGLSVKQWEWVKKLSDKLVNPAAPRVVSQKVENIAKLNELFDNAIESGLKTPRVYFQVGDDEIKLSIAGPDSRKPGTINVVSGEAWYGRIHRDGIFEHSSREELPRGWLEAINEFADSPLEAAVAYGRKTGRCCLCGRELTNHSSIEAGIGPICAGKWGIG